MGVLTLPKTVLMIVIWIIPAVVTIYFPQAFPFVIALGISGPVFLCAMLYNKTFKQYFLALTAQTNSFTLRRRKTKLMVIVFVDF